MNRRGFIQSLSTLVGGVLLDKVIPFNRVWSFPSKIVIPKYIHQTYALGTKVSFDLIEDDLYGFMIITDNSKSLAYYDHMLLS